MKNFPLIFFLASLIIFISFPLALKAQTPIPSPIESADKITPENIFDETEVISVNTSLVDIPVSVTDKNGRVITNLTKDDFHIFENGTEQKIENFASVEQPFTVVMLLDISGSMRFHLDDIKKAALAFVDQLKPTDRVVAATFDRHIQVLSTDLLDREKLRKAIKKIQPGGGTFLYATVEVVSNRLLRRFPGRKALLLFTDGADSWSSAKNDGSLPRSNYRTSLTAAESSGSLVYSVQFYPDSGRESETANSYLADLAENTGGRLFRPKKIKELLPAFVAIADELRHQYSIGYYPENAAKPNERRQIKVVVNQPDSKVRARESYVGKQ